MIKIFSRSIVWLVIVIMTCECISSAVVSLPDSSVREITIHQKAAKPSIFAAILSDKSEEENGRNEEERDKFFVIEILDFSQIAQALAIHFSPDVQVNIDEHCAIPGPKLFTLFCVLII